MVSLRKGKKGSIQDLVLVMSILLTISIVTLIAFKVSDSLNEQISTDASIAKYDINGDARQSMSRINALYPNVIDNSFLFLTVGLAMVALVLASLVRIHPIFFIFFLFILVIIIFMCGVFSNIYQGMAEQPELVDLAASLIFTTNIMRFLPFIVGTIGMVLSIVMYKTWQNA